MFQVISWLKMTVSKSQRFVKRKSRRWGSKFLIIVMTISLVTLLAVQSWISTSSQTNRERRVIIDKVKAAIARSNNKKRTELLSWQSLNTTSSTSTLDPDGSMSPLQTVTPKSKPGMFASPKVAIETTRATKSFPVIKHVENLTKNHRQSSSSNHVSNSDSLSKTSGNLTFKLDPFNDKWKEVNVTGSFIMLYPV